jgi:Binding-protein-dependent transport system inner membrane component
VGVVSTVITLVLGCMCAYGLARFRFPGRGTVAYTTLLLRTVPLAVLAIPVFLIWNEWQLVNSLWGLVLLYVAVNLPFTVWLLYGFVLQVPIELEEAAAIDGCGPMRVFTKVLLRLMVPGLAAASIFTFRIAWNEFMRGRWAAEVYRRGEQANKLTAFHDVLKQADARRPKHERRTAKALYAEIKGAGCNGGYTRVTDFIRAWRQAEGQQPTPSCRWPSSSARRSNSLGVKKGRCWAAPTTARVSHMELCAGRAFWLAAYPSQGHEMLRRPSLHGSFPQIAAHDRFGDAGRLVDAVDVDGHREGQLQATVHILDLGQNEPRAHAAVHPYRLRESHPVEPVVQTHVAEGHGLGQVVLVPLAQQRQRQEAVRDGAAVRRRRGGARGIDMDPLEVAGGLGELVDAVLTDGKPVGDADLSAHRAARVVDIPKKNCSAHGCTQGFYWFTI